MRRLFQYRADLERTIDVRSEDEWLKLKSGEPIWRWRTPVICVALFAMVATCYFVASAVWS